MPTSQPYQLGSIMELVVRSKPQSVLDVGVGFGKYGYLVREYLEIWGDGDQYEQWLRTIDGVEVFEPYIREVQRAVYNEVFIGNATEVLPTLEKQYDLILLIDVLEHFTYEDGMTVLTAALQKGRNIIVSTPWDIGVQGEGYGNVYETHHFQWKKKHFNQWPHFLYPNHQSMIVFAGKDAAAVGKGLRGSLVKRQLKSIWRMLFG